MLSITPISFSGIKTLPQTKKIAELNSAKDSFEKKTTTAFMGRNENEFTKWANETNFKPENIKKILIPKNKLGSGNSHSAYKIPNCENFVLRITTENENFLKNADYSKATITTSKNENIPINIGQEVAKITIKNQDGFDVNIQVLKKQEGIPIGIQRSETIYIGETDKLREGEIEYEHIDRKKYFSSSIHKVAELPLESYEDFIDNFTKAAKEGYMFDYLNSNNLLVDEKNKKINLIDMDKNINGKSVKPNYAGALYALSNIEYYPTFMSQYDNYPTTKEEQIRAIEDLSKIIKNFTQALLNKNIKLNLEEVPIEFRYKFMNSLPCFITFGAFNEQDVIEKMNKIGLIE